jgi:multidrug efflux pump subunit AcrA (membrane-fusion protein)
MSEENQLVPSDAEEDKTEAGEEMGEFRPEAETEASIPEPESQSEAGAEATIEEPETESEEEAEAAIPEPQSEEEADAAIAQAVAQPDAWPEEPAPAGAVPKASRPVTRARVFWTSAGCGLLAFVLAVAASMGILAVLNGGLRYAPPAPIMELSRKVDGLALQTDVLVQDLEGLRARLDNLEGLSGRMGEVEAATGSLQAAVAELQIRLAELEDLDVRVDAVQAAADQLQTDADQLQSEVQAVGAQVETLQEQGDRHQRFLEGLLDLLNNLFPKEEGQ